MRWHTINVQHNMFFLCLFLLKFTTQRVNSVTHRRPGMCSLRGFHRDVVSHGLLENTIYKLCHMAGPPSVRETAVAAHRAPFREKALQNKHPRHDKIVLCAKADNRTSVYLGFETGMHALGRWV